MLYTVFDLETTGFDSTRDDVVQLAYTRLDSKLHLVSSGNLYFYYDNMHWSEEAYAVHKIPQSFLQQHKDSFSENVRTAYAILQQGNLIGHNCDSFDIPFIANFLGRMGTPHVSPRRSFDTMKLFTKSFGKRPKLSDLPKHLDLSERQINFCLKNCFPDTTDSISFHDARYDVAVTTLAFTTAVIQGLLTLPR